MAVVMVTIGVFCPACRIPAPTAIPLSTWLPKGNSGLDDHYRRSYLETLKGSKASSRITAVLEQGKQALPSLFDELNDPTLDGEKSEGFSRDLVFALIVVGDNDFACELSKQPREIHRALAQRILNNLVDLGPEMIPRTITECRVIR
jgi:hypothetical protein